VAKNRHVLTLKPMSASRYKDALLKLSLSGGLPRRYDPPDYLQAPIVARSRGSSVGIATGYGLDDQGGREFESR
jgi:hypothetical protein